METKWNFIKLDASQDTYRDLTSGIYRGNNSAYYRTLKTAKFMNIQSSFSGEYFGYQPFNINNVCLHSFIYGFKPGRTTNRSTTSFSYIVFSSTNFDANPALFIDNSFCLSLFEKFEATENVEDLEQFIDQKLLEQRYHIDLDLCRVIVNAVDKMVKHDFKKTILLKNFDANSVNLIIQGVFYLLPKDIAKELLYATFANSQELSKFSIACQGDQSTLDDLQFIECSFKKDNIETSYGKFLLNNISRIDDIATEIQHIDSRIIDSLVASKKYSDAVMLAPIFTNYKDAYLNLKFDLQQIISLIYDNGLSVEQVGALSVVEQLLSASIDNGDADTQQIVMNLMNKFDLMSLISSDERSKFIDHFIQKISEGQIDFEKVSLPSFYLAIFEYVFANGTDEQAEQLIYLLSNNYIEAPFVRKYLTDLLTRDNSRKLIKYLFLTCDLLEKHINKQPLFSTVSTSVREFLTAVVNDVSNPRNVDSNLKILLSIEQIRPDRKNSLAFLAEHCFGIKPNSIDRIIEINEFSASSIYLQMQAHKMTDAFVEQSSKSGNERVLRENIDKLEKFYRNYPSDNDSSGLNVSNDRIAEIFQNIKQEKKSLSLLVDEQDGFLASFNQFSNYVKDISVSQSEKKFFRTISSSSYPLIAVFILVDLLLSIPIFYMDKVIFLYSLLFIPLTIIVSLIIQHLFEKTLKTIMMKYISLGAVFSSIIPLVLINICLFVLMFI